VILSTKRKAQIVADAIIHRRLPGDDLIDGIGAEWNYYLKWIRQYLQSEQDNLRSDFMAYFTAFSEEDKTRAEMIRECIDDPIEYLTAREIVAGLPDLEWLWKGWLPRRLVSLLAATPGTGKSYLGLDLARRIINGTEWPNGDAITDDAAGPVLYVDAENTPAIFKKRVSIWTPDELECLYLMLPIEDRSIINLDEYEDKDRLWDMVWDIRPRLVILDSYGSATLRGENNKEDVQLLLAFFNNLAKQLDTTVLIVHHLRKRHGPQTTFLPMTIDSIRGSSHIPAMARNVWGLQWIPTTDRELDQNGPRRLWVMKSNVGIYPDPVGIFFDSHPQNDEVALLRYGEAPQPYQERTKSDECAEWLEDLLREADEPMAPGDVVEMANVVGFNRRMVYRVRNKMDEIQDTEDAHHPDNKWQWAK
jgi:replicative DNA helicase